MSDCARWSSFGPCASEMLTVHSLGDQALRSFMHDTVRDGNCYVTQQLTSSIVNELSVKLCGLNKINLMREFTGKV